MGYQLKKEINPQWLADALGLKYKTTIPANITNIAPLFTADEGSLSFSKDGSMPYKPNVTLITSDEVNCESCIISENPRLDFIRALYFLNSEIGIDHNYGESKIHPSVKLGNNVVIEKGVEIGKDTTLEANVVIAEGTKIGNGCLIRANTSIGSDGFGFERLPDGTPLKFIHLGGVLIGNNVEIGANTCIAKGTLGNTVLEDNVKIDNLVHIAHNCIIKKGAFIIACAEISGGVVIGENAWVAPNVSIAQKVVIGENSLVGMGSMVRKNVDSDTVVVGNPAKFLRNI